MASRNTENPAVTRVYISKTLGSRYFLIVPEASSDLPWRLQAIALNARSEHFCYSQRKKV